MGYVRCCFALVAIALSTARADASVIFTNFSSATYTPGVALEFDLAFGTSLTGLNSYFIELTLAASDGSAIAGPAGEFYFDDAATYYPATGGVFGPAPGSGFFVATATANRLSLSDFLLVGEVDTLPGDILARVSIYTTRDVGTLTLSIDATSLELARENFDPVPEYADVVSSLPTPSSLSPVPEPLSMTMWFFGCVMGGFSGLRRRIFVSAPPSN